MSNRSIPTSTPPLLSFISLQRYGQGLAASGFVRGRQGDDELAEERRTKNLDAKVELPGMALRPARVESGRNLSGAAMRRRNCRGRRAYGAPEPDET